MIRLNLFFGLLAWSVTVVLWYKIYQIESTWPKSERFPLLVWVMVALVMIAALITILVDL